MKFHDYYNRVNWRAVSIGIGVLSSILWIFHACYSTISRSPFSFEVYSNGLIYGIAFSTFIFSVASSAASMLLVVGIRKGIVRYTLPWLAIHFVIVLFIIPMYLYMIIVNYPMILIALAVTFLWTVVFQYSKSLLSNTTPVQPANPEKDEILEIQDDAINPYHPDK